MWDDFLIRAALAGIGLAVAAGPLGAFVVWRRMAYFGDATAHAALLGVAIALSFGVSVFLGVAITALAMALAVARLSAGGQSVDATLGVLSHGALAFGLVAASFVPSARVGLDSWLFGDVLAIGPWDVATIWIGAMAVLALMVWRWNRLLIATLNRELAASSGVDAEHEELILMVALALIVAVAIKVVGTLLIAAVLIIPSAAARNLTRSPEGMAVVATLLGILSVLLGLQGSWVSDTPAGPSIVSAAALLYAVSHVAGYVLRPTRSRAQ